MKNKLIPIRGIITAVLLAVAANKISSFIPGKVISGGVFAMLIGMLLYPLITNKLRLASGLRFVSKKILKLSIILMGATLSMTQVMLAGSYSLIVMVFTLITAFGLGNIVGRWFGMNWKLSNLISAGTGICGGSAIAAISPVIEADDNDIAYAISATFIFDVVMVVLFPLMGRALGLSDLNYGLWAGTAVNDTSSVVAAGYAFSDAAGQFATIVKLTRTLSIVPIVMIFSWISHRQAARDISDDQNQPEQLVKPANVNISRIFPWFILLFLGMVALRTGLDLIAGKLVSDNASAIKNASDWLTIANISSAASRLAGISKFAMVMALGAIGLNTDFAKLSKSGFKPMLHGFIISAAVVIVSLLVQSLVGQA